MTLKERQMQPERHGAPKLRIDSTIAEVHCWAWYELRAVYEIGTARNDGSPIIEMSLRLDLVRLATLAHGRYSITLF
jgi:hypothetical protein